MQREGTIVAMIRRLIGTTALVIALIIEAYIGGRITDDGNDTLTAVHVPLAMAVLALAVWLPIRAGSSRPNRRRRHS